MPRYVGGPRCVGGLAWGLRMGVPLPSKASSVSFYEASAGYVDSSATRAVRESVDPAALGVNRRASVVLANGAVAGLMIGRRHPARTMTISRASFRRLAERRLRAVFV